MPIIRRKDLKNQVIAKSLDSHSSKEKILEEVTAFSPSKSYHIFLSHSYLDAAEIDVLYEDIKEMGFSVYIDWKEDSQLDRNKVSAETANILKERMNCCSCLLYVATNNSSNSKWCPWELGYFDGKKGKSAIFPILDIDYNTNSYKGTEYLGIYPYITRNVSKTGVTTLWVHENKDTYISLHSWLNGINPYRHHAGSEKYE